jgi:hypothetical protein
MNPTDDNKLSTFQMMDLNELEKFLTRLQINFADIELVKLDGYQILAAVAAECSRFLNGSTEIITKITKALKNSLRIGDFKDKSSELLKFLTESGVDLGPIESKIDRITAKIGASDFKELLHSDFAKNSKRLKTIPNIDTILPLLAEFNVIVPFSLEENFGLEVLPVMGVLTFLRNNTRILGIDETLDSNLSKLSLAQISRLAIYFRDQFIVSKSTRTLIGELKSLGILSKPIEPESLDWLEKSIKSMQSDYLDIWDLLGSFHIHLLSCVENEIKFRDYMAPYSTIVQSSGNGKSKLILEYAKQQMVIYASLGSPDSSCIPPGNPAISLAFKQKKTVDSMVELICFIYITAIRKLKGIEEGGNTLKKFMELQHIYPPVSSTFFDNFSYSEGTFTLEMLYDELSDPQIAERYPILLLAIDEARGLLTGLEVDGEPNCFRFFRRGLGKVASFLRDKDSAESRKRSQIFAVLCDTSSKVSNFSPPSNLDPSGRYNGSRQKLHPPFTGVINMDAPFVHKKSKDPNWTVSEDAFFRYDFFFGIGRPIFGIYLNNTKEGEGKIDAVVKFAQAKILGRPVEQTNETNCTEEALIALLNIRVPLSLAKYGTLTETLTSSHMRIIRSLSESREMIFGYFGNEPVLAHAAQELSFRDLFFPDVLLKNFKKNLMCGLCEKGNVGEQMLAYIYILARDQVFSQPRNSHLFKVRELLQQIDPTCASILKTGLEFNARQEKTHLSNIAKVVMKRQGTQESEEKWIEDQARKSETTCTTNKDARIQNLSLILDSDLTFSHFLNIENTPCLAQLEEAFYRGYGFVSYPNQAGVDIYIPIRMKGTAARCMKNYEYIATRGVFPNAHKSFAAKDEKVSPIEIPEARIDKLTSTASFTMSSVVQKKTGSIFSAICIQCKNSAENTVSDDVYIDLASSGVPNSADIPCLGIKHVLRSSNNSMKPMAYQEKPYRHGIVIEGIDVLKHYGRMKDVKLVMESILEVNENPLLHIPRNDEKLKMAGATMNSYKLEKNFIRSLFIPSKIENSVNQMTSSDGPKPGKLQKMDHNTSQ